MRRCKGAAVRRGLLVAALISVTACDDGPAVPTILTVTVTGSWSGPISRLNSTLSLFLIEDAAGGERLRHP